jgi:phospholipid-binding lipoprotein MlaA
MTLFQAVRKFVFLLPVIGIAGCATVDPNADFSDADNYEGTARKVHEFNIAVDRTIVRPLSQGYDAVTPATIKHVIGNGFSHLTLPRDFANHLMQGEIKHALETLGRFTINTVLGAGGFLDPATEFGLPKQDTDFGITLAKHGSGEGSYLVLPLIGPTTERDAVGWVVDLAFAPTTYIGFVKPGLSPEVPLSMYTLRTVDFRDRNRAVIDDLLYESDDSYVSLRAVYLQNRRAMVAGEEGTAETLPDIFDQN